MPSIGTLIINALFALTSFEPLKQQPQRETITWETTPILLWHGMGDSYDSTGMQRLITILQESYPNAPIHSIALEESNAKDQQRGIMGDAMSDIQTVCEALKNSTEFNDGVHGIGMSQGGLFLRALASTCDIKFNSLITFGSPHQGFSDLPTCDPDSWNYWICQRRNAALKAKMYSDYFQENIIQAQYFRDNLNYETYLEKSSFLKWVNNDLFKDLDIWDNLTSLDKFVMVMFEKDETLVPKESAWFQELNSDGDLIPFEETESYQFDSIGLKTLQQEDKLFFESIDNFHCQMTEDQFLDIVNRYI